MATHTYLKQTVDIEFDHVTLTGDLVVPPDTEGIVLFAHGSGSSRHSTRNRAVARMFNSYGFGTLLFDLLTPEEENLDRHTGALRFDIDLLAQRLVGTTFWVKRQSFLDQLCMGYFGASTGAAAALMAAPQVNGMVKAIVSRGGRPDLAPRALPLVTASTLLLVGENDPHVLALNQQAYEMLHCD